MLIYFKRRGLVVLAYVGLELLDSNGPLILASKLARTTVYSDRMTLFKDFREMN
jgi:hypothetical protein